MEDRQESLHLARSVVALLTGEFGFPAILAKPRGTTARKDRSYYPLVAHVAQTRHILRLKNRPGDVQDSKQAAAFLLTHSVALLSQPLPIPVINVTRFSLPARSTC